MTEKKRIMSGMRPTGKLHVGHHLGVLKNWVDLQDSYDCFFAVADWHALTTKYDSTDDFVQNVRDVVLDWVACGIDPEKSTIYLQSLVPETAELFVYLSMITPQNWVERDPTLKDIVKILRGKGGENDENPSNVISYGLLGYPVLQTADILSFNASLVPVGSDQLAHLEVCRDVVRRFNYIYKTNYFNEPQPKLTETPLILGLDGQKMGKSFNNDIKISDDEDTTAKKIMKAITDPARMKKTDLGHPDECVVVYQYYKVFGEPQNLREECENALRGCVDCKKQLAEMVNEYYRPIREKRRELEQNIDEVDKIIRNGSEKARRVASEVLKDVKKIIKIYL